MRAYPALGIWVLLLPLFTHRTSAQTTSQPTSQLASATTRTGSHASSRPAAAQHFVCNVGYSPQQCERQMSVLRLSLGRYGAGQLGDWTWVLVRSEDWKPFKRLHSLDPDSPAFTALNERMTFFEEALVSPVPLRRLELFNQWFLGTDDLLQLAVTHELGHALCGEHDETKADAYGELLRKGKPVHCR